MTVSDIHRATVPTQRRYWTAVAVYVVLTFVFAATWHMAIFAGLYRELAIYTREEPIVPLGLASVLLQGLVIAWAYPRFAARRHPLREGLVFGILCGLFLASAAVLGEAGKQNVTSLPVFLALETVFYLLLFGLSGMAIGLVYGRSGDGP